MRLVHIAKMVIAMSEFLSRLTSNDVCVLMFFAGIAVVGLAAIAAGCWHSLRKEEIAANLKQDMLNRGMSAEDIKTVLEAGPKK